MALTGAGTRAKGPWSRSSEAPKFVAGKTLIFIFESLYPAAFYGDPRYTSIA